MFSYFQKFLDWVKSLFWKEEMELTLVGLQFSGKSTFVHVIATGSFSEEMMPTVGFAMRKITKGAVTIKMWDIGGQPRFRSMWERYCRGVNAIVFMVDAADFEKIDSARAELHSLLERPQLAGIPLLVLGNKRDLPNALDENGLISKLGLSTIADREVCCYSISCKNKQNLDITLNWLISHAGSKARRNRVNSASAAVGSSSNGGSGQANTAPAPAPAPASALLSTTFQLPVSSAPFTTSEQPQLSAAPSASEPQKPEKAVEVPATRNALNPATFVSDQPPAFAESLQNEADWPAERTVEPVADQAEAIEEA